jgi:hypothetical protein
MHRRCRAVGFGEPGLDDTNSENLRLFAEIL